MDGLIISVESVQDSTWNQIKNLTIHAVRKKIYDIFAYSELKKILESRIL